MTRAVARFGFTLTLALNLAACAQVVRVAPNELMHSPWQAVARAPTVVRENDVEVVRFDERADAGALWNPHWVFEDGTIEVDVRGRDVLQKSFVGIAFRMIDAGTLEVVWLRPFNFRSADPVRRTRAIQFASYPDYPWQRLRAEHPGVFEASLPVSVAPDDWVHLRVEVHGRHVRVFVDRAVHPALDVETPDAPRAGGIGLWVGSDSDGDFRNLEVTVSHELTDRPIRSCQASCRASPEAFRRSALASTRIVTPVSSALPRLRVPTGDCS